ncbi:hypothetical protein L1887_54046 [Cichorium endivia]|nr:hypothetical protein L1887_54046 [Cichorium endivia]
MCETAPLLPQSGQPESKPMAASWGGQTYSFLSNRIVAMAVPTMLMSVTTALRATHGRVRTRTVIAICFAIRDQHESIAAAGVVRFELDCQKCAGCEGKRKGGAERRVIYTRHKTMRNEARSSPCTGAAKPWSSCRERAAEHESELEVRIGSDSAAKAAGSAGHGAPIALVSLEAAVTERALLCGVDLDDATATAALNVEAAAHAATLVLAAHLAADAIAHAERRGTAPKDLQRRLDHVDRVGGALDGSREVRDADGAADGVDDGRDAQAKAGGTRTQDDRAGAPLGLELRLDGARAVGALVDGDAVERLDGLVEGLASGLGGVGVLALAVADEAVAVAGDDERIHAGVLALGGHVHDALEHDGVAVQVAHLAHRQRRHGGEVLLRVDLVRVRARREHQRVGRGRRGLKHARLVEKGHARRIGHRGGGLVAHHVGRMRIQHRIGKVEQ